MDLYVKALFFGAYADGKKEEEHDDHDDHAEQSKTLIIRIVAVFASAVVTLLGLSVFFFKQSNAISTSTLLCLRAGSAGAMISVAIVHILPEAAHELESVTPYPLAGTLVLGTYFAKLTTLFRCVCMCLSS